MRWSDNCTTVFCLFTVAVNIITKLPESGDLCGNITDIAIQISRRRLFYFYILLFNDFMSFPAIKVYQINMYLLLYLSFKIKMLEYT